MNVIQYELEKRLVEKQAFIVYMGLQHIVHEKTCNQCSFEENPQAYFDYIHNYKAAKARLHRKAKREYFRSDPIHSICLDEDEALLMNHDSYSKRLCCQTCLHKYNPNRNKRFNDGISLDPSQMKGIFDE